MSYPVFYLALLDASHHTVGRMPSGSSLERELVSAIGEAIVRHGVEVEAVIQGIVARGVGFTKTAAHVEADVRAELATLPGLLQAAVADALEQVVWALKVDSRYAVR